MPQKNTQSKNIRTIFIEELVKIMKKDKSVIFLTGDVGFSYAEPIRDKLPDQYINCGLAEQNLIGVATGLALAGKQVWVYSMIPFILFRPYEQIRTACYHNANIKIIGIKGGASYGFLGFSHNTTESEDLGVLSHLPNIKWFCPDTPEQLKKVVLESYEIEGPCYIRI